MRISVHQDFFVFLLFFFGTLSPSLRASDRPMAMACLRLFTVPPLPPGPLLSVPFLRSSSAFATLLEAALEYLRAMFDPLAGVDCRTTGGMEKRSSGHLSRQQGA